MKHFEFIAVHEVPLVQTLPAKFVVADVKLEFTNVSEALEVAAHSAQVVPVGQPAILGTGGRLQLVSGRPHLICTARVQVNANPMVARLECEGKIDRALTLISLLLNPFLLGPCLYRGWRWRDGNGVVEMPVRLEEPVVFHRDQLGQMFAEFWDKSPVPSREMELMARFFVKGLMQIPLTEERFLFMWTVLEIFPMRNTTDIRPISEVLSPLVSLSPEEFKRKLEVGKIFGVRSDLVHNGRFEPFESRGGGLRGKLEALAIEALRMAAGLPYGGSFSQFLE